MLGGDKVGIRYLTQQKGKIGERRVYEGSRWAFLESLGHQNRILVFFAFLWKVKVLLSLRVLIVVAKVDISSREGRGRYSSRGMRLYKLRKTTRQKVMRNWRKQS